MWRIPGRNISCLPDVRRIGPDAANALSISTANPQIHFLTASSKIIVLVFLRRDCPVSSRYAPVIQQISEHYQRDASFCLVFPDKDERRRRSTNISAEYAYHLPALRDPEHTLVKLAQVQITPEVAVFNRNRKLVYHGRIDNWYLESRPLASGAHNPRTQRRDRSGARRQDCPLESAVRGVGCYISDLE